MESTNSDKGLNKLNGRVKLAAVLVLLACCSCSRKSEQRVADTSRVTDAASPTSVSNQDTTLPSQSSALPSKVSVPPSDWARMEDRGLGGIGLDYPDSLRALPEFRKNHNLDMHWRFGAASDKNSHQVVSIPVYSIERKQFYPRYYTVEVRVGMSTDSAEMAACDRAGNGEQAIGTIEINGVMFHQFAFQDAAMMQYVKGISYRTRHNGKCYAVEQLISASNYREKPSSNDIPDKALNEQYFLAGKIVKTFHFLN